MTKHANEGTAKIYWLENQIRSAGIRPYVIYGPGRDQATSTPTKAMLAAAVGRPYHISFGGIVVYHHAEDAAEMFIRAARSTQPGAEVYNLATPRRWTKWWLASTPPFPRNDRQDHLEPIQLATPTAIDESKLIEALGKPNWRPLAEGVGQTVAHFRKAAAEGKVAVDRILS